MKQKILLIITLIIGSVFALPMILTITNSFMTPEEIMMNQQRIPLIPQKLSLRQYYTLLLERSEYLGMFWKSVVCTGCIVIGNSLYSIFVGSMLAKIRMKGKTLILLLYIIGILIPYQVNMIPYYIQFKLMNLLESDIALILPMIVAPFGVVVVTFMVRSVPDELIEAIRLETNGLYYIFKDAIFPTCKGGITILIIFIFAEAWNMVEQPMTVYSDLYKQPLSVLLSTMQYDINIVFAACVVYMIPVIISYFFFEESLDEEFLQIRV